MKIQIAMLCAALFALAAFAKTSTPEGWLDDYDAALKKAAAENKHVVIDFSGSDWCGWCKRLDKEVFATEEFRKGADVVSGVRSSRRKDTAFKRGTARAFYRLMRRMGVEMVYDHGDYRLLSRRALDALLSFGEVNMFLRGMVPMLGFRTAVVEYERGERVAGESKYPLKKMIAFAMEGITSLSNKPIRYVLLLGALCALLGVAMAVYVIVSVARGHTVAGWASLMMSVWLLGGLQLMALGLIGEYVGKIYMETKRRPKFILEEHLK